MERTQCYCFAIEPIVLFQDELQFPFHKTKNRSKFTALQKKYIVLIINKYKLLSTIFYLNNKITIEEITICRKKYDANEKNVIA